MIRFHLDESADGRLGRALRRRGFDITFPVEVGLLESSDEEHLAFAFREGRVVITQDDDFLKLHHSGTKHAGIAYYKPGRHTVAELVSFVCLLHDCLESAEMVGQIQYL